jgi:hypothetical protein
MSDAVHLLCTDDKVSSLVSTGEEFMTLAHKPAKDDKLGTKIKKLQM